MFSPELLKTKLPDFMYKAYVEHEQAIAKGEKTPLTQEEREQLFAEYFTDRAETQYPIKAKDLDALRLTFPEEWGSFTVGETSTEQELASVRAAIQDMYERDGEEHKTMSSKRRK